MQTLIEERELAYIFIGTSKMIASDSLLFAMNILCSIHDELLLVELFAKWQETCIYFFGGMTYILYQ